MRSGIAAFFGSLAVIGALASPAMATERIAAPGAEGRSDVQPLAPGSAALEPDGLGRESNAPAPTTGVHFLSTTLPESGFIPPDTTGAVGDSNIVIPLNGRIKVFSKTGTQQYSATLNDFFSSVLPSGNAFDPRVEYDALTDRWFVIAINGGANNTVMIATSNGSDVSAGESAFTFRSFVHSTVIPGDVGEFADYPTLATDANSLLIGTNNFLGSYNSSSLFVLNKAALIGGTVTVTGFQNVGTVASGMFTPQPAENDTPGATESYVIGVDNALFGILDFRRVTYPAGVPTLGPQIQITVPPTALSLDDVPAQGSTIPVDALDDRLYEAMVKPDPSGTPKLWTAHNMEMNSSGAATNSGDRIGSRWYELGSLAGTGTPSVLQAGTLFDGAGSSPDSYWIPSIAANGQGHAVIGTSVAGPARFVGIALAQRFAGEAAGTLGPVNFTQPGAGSYTVDFGSGRNRWGDYSQISIDPEDNMTFWAFQEYVSAVNEWAVRVIEVKAPPPATPASSSPPSVAPGQPSVSVTITGTSSNGSGFYDPGAGFPDRIGASVTGGVTVNSVTFTDPTHVTLDLNTTGASTGLQDVTITNPDGQSATGNDVLRVGLNQAPVLATVGNKTVQAGSPLSFTLSATDADGDPITYSGSNLPAGATVNATTGQFSWTPSAAQVGTHAGVILSASDGTATDSETITITVTAAPSAGDKTAPQTTITSSPPNKVKLKKGKKKAKVSWQFSANEPASFFCSLDGAAAVKCSSPFSAKVRKGKHTFSVFAVDAAGNVDGSPATDTFKVKRKKRRR